MANLTEIARSTQGMLYSGTQLVTAQLDTLEAISEGVYQISDPTNPAVNILEMSAMIGASLKFDREITLRKLFPAMAQTYDDLYLHMSDEDHLYRFATPAITPFNFIFRKDEILARAVEVPGTSIKKLVLPKFTAVTIAGVTHTLTYPIEFRVLQHGGIQITYDTSEQNPIQLLESNIVNYQYVKGRDMVENILLTVPLPQYLKTTYLESLNPSTGFSQEFSFNDQFYHCRVFMASLDAEGAGDVYTEISTSHTDIIYDVTKPTAILKVLDGKLRVEVPQIYFNLNMLSYKLRVDIYTTRGQILMDLADYNTNAFSVEYGDGLDTAEESRYIAPLNALAVKGAWSAAVIDGGSNGLAFTDLREKVVMGAINPKNIITDEQLKARLQVNGYDIVLAIDNSSLRVFYATRNLPAPTPRVIADESVDVSNFITGAGCSIDTVQVIMDDLVSLPYVIDNGERMTITPKALYKYENGVPRLLVSSEIPVPDNMSSDALVAIVNNERYAYSPFYYVLDTTGDTFDCRAYHLDAPEVAARSFVAENSTTGLMIGTAGYYIQKVDVGYRILLTTSSDAAYKELDPATRFAQLGYTPPGETATAFINGTLYGLSESGDDVWEFIIRSSSDIDVQDRIYLDQFSMFSGDYRTFPANLLETFQVFYSVSDYDYFGMQKTDIDLAMGKHLLPASAIGLTQEKFTIRLGSSLKNLWVNGRNSVSSIRYQLYEEDVPYLRTETKFVEDVNGVPIVTFEDGEAVYEVLYRKGDPVTIDGEIVYKHRKGEPVKDADGNLIPVSDRKSLRLLDIFLVDGIYYFATYPTDLDYKASIAKTVTSYVIDFLAPLSASLLQKTRLYFYPKKTIGNTKMVVGNQIEISMPAGLSFVVRPYVSSTVYRDEVRKKAISRVIAETINRRLSRPTVSISDMMESMREAVGDDVIAFDMDKMGQYKDIAAFTAVDDSRRCSVKRVLEVQPDQTLRVREDIVIDWVVHRST